MPAGLFPYAATGDEAFPDGEVAPAYAGIAERPRPPSARPGCAAARTPGTRSSAPAASRSAWPARRPPGCSRSTWCRGSCRPPTGRELQAGLVQRVRALDAFLSDVYGDRVVVADGVVPDWVIDGSPELRPERRAGRPARRARPGGRHRPGPRRRRQLVRAGGQPAGAVRHRVRDAEPPPHRRRAARAAAARTSLLDVEGTPALLQARRCSTRPAAGRRRRPGDRGAQPGPGATRPGSSTGCSPRRWACRWSAAPTCWSTTASCYRLRDGTRHRVDVIYLRMDEDSLVHSPGADGMPLGPEPGRRRCTRTPSRWPTRWATASATTRRCTPTCPS